MFESGTPRDRAEIAASEAEKAVGENRRRQLRRLCHQVEAVVRRSRWRRTMGKMSAALGENAPRQTDRQTASEGACGTSEREHTCSWKRAVWGYFGRQDVCGGGL